MRELIEVTKKTVKGYVEFDVRVNGEPVDRLGEKLCGYTSVIGVGPLRAYKWNTIFFGNHEMGAPNNWPILSDNDTAAERAAKIVRRITMVRSWVADCKAADAAASGRAVVEIPPTVESLQAEIARLKGLHRKRDKNGQYVKE